MNKENYFRHLLWLVFAGIVLVNSPVKAQRKLSLDKAINLAKQNNQWNKIAQQELQASLADYQDSKNAVLPQVTMAGSYQRFSKVTLFTDGLSDSKNITRRPGPTSAGTGIEAAFNLYTGGRQKAQIQEQKQRAELAGLTSLEQQSSITLQVSTQYFDLVNMIELQKLIAEQLSRAEVRLKNIQALYKNTKVTRSDVLRAEVMLANIQLLAEKASNDRLISSNRLKLLMNDKEESAILPSDSAGLTLPEMKVLSLEKPDLANFSFPVRKAAVSESISQTRLSLVKSNYKPTVTLFSAYNLSYPNYLFYPPVDQAYSVGFMGVKVQYSLSSLYHNKNKELAASIRLQTAKQVERAVSDNVKEHIESLYIKYYESLNRIAVAQKNIGQAGDNYRIVSTKYFNQLALLIDLLDADNLLQESKYSLIRSQVDAWNYYHQIRFAQGIL